MTLQHPIMVRTSGCGWTEYIRVHTVRPGYVVGIDDTGKEIDLAYDWLGGPTRHVLHKYELERNAKEKEGVPPLSRHERDALDYMHRQYRVRL